MASTTENQRIYTEKPRMNKDESEHADDRRSNDYKSNGTKRKYITISSCLNTLNKISSNNEFDSKLLDALIISTTIPKAIFISRIRRDTMLTARILKYFPGNLGFINYTKVALVGHLLLASLPLENNAVASEVRTKIGGNDIWCLSDSCNKDGKLYEILKSTADKHSSEKVAAFADQVREWHTQIQN